MTKTGKYGKNKIIDKVRSLLNYTHTHTNKNNCVKWYDYSILNLTESLSSITSKIFRLSIFLIDGESESEKGIHNTW